MKIFVAPLYTYEYLFTILQFYHDTEVTFHHRYVKKCGLFARFEIPTIILVTLLRTTIVK